MKRIFFLSLLALLFVHADTFAAKRYWIAGSAAYWNNTANWSTSSGGGSGASVPGASDTAYFDGNGTGNDTFDINVSVRRIDVAAGYSGTIVQGNKTLTLGTGGGVFSGGTFAGGSAAISTSAAITISGCAFTSTSGTLTTGSNFTVSSGSFTHNSGKISFNASLTLTISRTGGVSFNNLDFVPTAAASTFTVTSTTTINVGGTLTIGGTKTSTFSGGTMNIQGNVTTASSTIAGGGGTTTFNFNGTGSQSLTGHATSVFGRVPSITVNKASGTLSLSAIIATGGNWTHTTGTVNEGSAVMIMYGSPTISGGPTFYGVWLAPGSTYTITGGTMTVKGLLAYGGGATTGPVINSGTINVTGNIDLSNHTNTTGTGGTGTIAIVGTTNQTFTGSVFGAGRVCNLVINKPSGTLTLVDFIQVQKNWTHTAGNLNQGTSTVVFAGTKTILGTDTLNHVVFDGAATSTYTLSMGASIVVDSNLQFNGSSPITLDSGNIYAHYNVTTTNSSTSTGGNCTITINGNVNQILTGSGSAGAGKFPHINIDKTDDTLKLVNTISCIGNWIYTKGIVNPGGVTVAFYGTRDVDGQAASGDSLMHFYRVQVSGGTRTLTGDLYCRENFVFATGTTVSAGTYDISLGGNWNGQGTWSHGNDTITFFGRSYNRIQGPSGLNVSFAHVVVDRPNGSVTCITPVLIDSSMVLRLGRIKTTITNYLRFNDNAKCIVDNDDSAYVCGPVQKVGNDAFTFPLGDTLLHDSIAYHPLGITAPGNVSDRYEAIYHAVGQSLGSTLVDTLTSISDCEYWNIEKQNGSSNVTVKVYWNQNSCGVDNYDDLRMAGWLSSGSKWIDLGVSDLNPGFPTGNLSTGVALNFGTQTAWNIVIGQRPNFSPYATLKKKLDAGYYQCSNGKLMFRFQDEYNDPDAKLSFRIYNDQYGLMTSDQIISSGTVPNVYYGSNYYLLNVLDCEVVPNGNVLNGFFILEVINEKGERWYLRFKHTTSLNPNCEGTEPTE